jgi:hypothetical protein
MPARKLRYPIAISFERCIAAPNRSLSKLRLKRKGICSNKNGVKNIFSGFPPSRE